MSINYQELVKKLLPYWSKKDNKKAIIQIITSFGPYFWIFVACYFLWDYARWSIPFLIIINAFFLVRIFIIQHDCGHKSYFCSKKHQKRNELIWWLCSIFSSLPFKYRAVVHHHHHTHTWQLEERDIGDINFLTVEEFKQLPRIRRVLYQVFRSPPVLFFFAPLYYFAFANRQPFRFNFRRMTAKIKRSQLSNNLLIIWLYIGLYYLLGGKFLSIQLLTILSFSIIAFRFFYVQHSHEETYHRRNKSWEWNYIKAALHGASRYDLPKFMHFLTGRIGMHHLHHLNPNIPSYNLAQADKATFKDLKNHITNLSFWKSFSCIKYKLWDDKKNKMISRSEYYKKYKYKK